ncbi:MAG: FISUMP domain-containing protein [Mucinivorans sp.]
METELAPMGSESRSFVVAAVAGLASDNLHGFLFVDGLLVAKYINIKLDESSRFTTDLLETGTKRHFYLLANADKMVDLSVFVENSYTEALFENLVLRSTSLGGQIDPVLIGVCDVSKPSPIEQSMQMSRAYARVDLDMTSDPNIIINKMTIQQACDASYLFAKSPIQMVPGSGYVDIVKSFVPGVSSLQQAVCLLHEQSGAELMVEIDATLNGVTEHLQAKLPANIVRNHLYKINITVSELKLNATVELLPWNEQQEDLMPDLTSSIVLNQVQSVIPANTELRGRDLHFSYRAGQAILAFDGLFDKALTVIQSDAKIKIEEVPSEYKNSVLTITATQPFEGKACVSKFRLTNSMLVGDPGVEYTIRVDENRIASVVIGGLEYMAYNGIGKDLSLYPPLELNQTVRDVYRTVWKKYTAMCMWGDRTGSQPMLYPWEISDATNTSGNVIGDSWTVGASVPCPEGWRVPSYDELDRLWNNNGSAAVGSFVADGRTYTTSIVESLAPDVEIPGTNPLQTIKTKLFVVSDGTNELIFPMNGWRRRKDYAGGAVIAAADAGTAFYLWTAQKGSSSWQAKVVGVNNNNTIFNNPSGNSHQLMTEAFMNVRCVRNL